MTWEMGDHTQQVTEIISAPNHDKALECAEAMYPDADNHMVMIF